MVMQTWHDVHPHGKSDIFEIPSEYSMGGSFEKAFAYLVRWGGLINEAKDPYPSTGNQYVTYRSDIQSPAIWHVQSYEQYAPKASVLGHDAIKRAIMRYGGVWVSYCATDCIYYNDVNGEFYTYDEAVRYMESGGEYYWLQVPFLSDDGKSFYNCCTSFGHAKLASNHAVLLVGWDDDYSRTNFCYSPNGNGAYLIKNSWGEDFGDGGYLWVSYYDDNMLYDSSYAIPSVSPSDNYSEIYQHDPLGLVYQFPYSEYKWGANVFMATNDTRLAAVGFYSMSPGTAYTIKIHTGVSAANPVSGICVNDEGQTGSVSYAGFATIVLNSPVTIKAGERFSIVLHLESPGEDEPFGSEVNLPYRQDWTKKVRGLQKFSYSLTSRVTALAGQSFVSTDGTSGTWRDIVTDVPSKCVEKEGYVITVTDENGVAADIYDEVIYDTSSANLCIKGYMQSAPTSATLTSIEISGSGTSVAGGEVLSLTCTASYDNAQPKDVTALANWAIEKGSGYADVISPGRIKTMETTENQLISVKAAYEEEGITKEDTWDFYVVAAAPETPAEIVTTQGSADTHVHIEWSESHGATCYSIYRSRTASVKNASHIYDVKGETCYNDTGAIPGRDYWYFVKAGNIGKDNKLQYSGFSTGANGWRKLAPPESVTASDTLLDKVALEWSEVEGATHYRVYRAENIDGEKTALGNWQSATTFNDTTATAGVTYYYFVVAAVDANGSRPSDFSIVEDGTRAVPVTIDHLEIKGDASVNAGAYADYAADAIYTDGHKVENVTPNNWKIVGDGASVVGCRVTAASVTENKTVTLVATYTEDGKTVTGEKSITIAAVKPVAPHNVAATVAAEGVTLSWGAVAGAASYAIYRDGNAVGRVVPNAPGDVPSTTYTDSSAIPGVTYSYTVSASNGAGEGPQSSPAVTATIPLPAPAGVTATTDRTDGVLVDWRRVMDNAPYQNGEYYFRVARATSDNGAKTELGSWTTDTSFLDTSAQVDTPLWYFVRAATSADGANASEWSAGVVGRVVPNAPQLLAISISGPDRVASSGSAVYSCTAAYDDGTVASVAPSWSASGAAAIDANGKLTAHAVTADTDVTVTAAFGGKSATKDVKVQAPVQASASISNVRVTPRWPFSSLVDIDYTLATAPEGTRALVTLSGQDNDHNVPMAAKTLTGDGASGVVAAGERRLTWDVGADYPGFHASSFGVTLEAVPYVIAAPANVSASQGTSTRGVNLSWEAVDEATGYEIWRAQGSMNVADAILVTNVEAVVAYEDTAVNPGDIYFYWFKTVTQYGTGDFSASVFGYRARVVGTVAFDATGGTASASSLGYTAGSPYGTLPSATRTGYDFDGWFTSATGGNEVTATTPADESIATLYAHWTPHTYTIHFDANGGTGTMADMSVPYGITMNLPSHAFTKSGYVFDGWATNDNGRVYGDNAGVANLTAEQNGTVVLRAVWVALTVNGVDVWMDSPSSVGVRWRAVPAATAYRIYDNTYGDATTVPANTTNVTLSTRGGNLQWSAYTYQVQALYGDVGGVLSESVSCVVDLMPLRNLLNSLDRRPRNMHIDDDELDLAMANSHKADLDGDADVISTEEMAVFTRIQAYQQADYEFLSYVMQGDYTLEAMTYSVMYDLQDLSDTIKRLRATR